MKRETLTSKERVNISLSWQEPDRVPIQTYLTPEIHDQLKKHFNGRDVNECLGVDFRTVWPSCTRKMKESHDGIWYDEWGAGYRSVSNATAGSYCEAVVLPLADLKTMDEVEAYRWPKVEDYDFSMIEEQCGQLKDFCITAGCPSIPDIVNGVSRGRGMEQVLMDIVLRDEVGMAIIDKRVDFYYAWCEALLAAAKGKIDILHLGEDCGNQNGRMVSPTDFDEVFRPRIEKFIELAHEHGAKAMMHSCGDTHDIMPTFIDMKLDVLDAMQPEPKGMVPENIRSLCKGKLAFCGLISTQYTLPHKSEAECRAEARHRLDVIAPGGGYIFSPAHCIQPDTPLCNILAIYEEALGRKR